MECEVICRNSSTSSIHWHMDKWMARSLRQGHDDQGQEDDGANSATLRYYGHCGHGLEGHSLLITRMATLVREADERVEGALVVYEGRILGLIHFFLVQAWAIASEQTGQRALKKSIKDDATNSNAKECVAERKRERNQHSCQHALCVSEWPATDRVSLSHCRQVDGSLSRDVSALSLCQRGS